MSKSDKEKAYYYSVHQVVGAATFYLSDECAVEINDLQRDVLQSAIGCDLSDAAIYKVLAGDAEALHRLMQACASVAAITGHAWMPAELIVPSMSQAHGGAGGKESGAVRRGWQEEAFAFAEKVCADSTSNMTQPELAEKIEELWASKGLKPYVDRARLVRVIREWESGRHKGMRLVGRKKGL